MEIKKHGQASWNIPVRVSIHLRSFIEKTFWTNFTLIELLVVIAIISILMTLLLPALSSAKKIAKQAQCMGKMKQFAVAHEMYMSDYDSYISTGVPNGTNVLWYYGICPYIENGKEWDGAKMSPCNNPSGNWSCPENPSGKGDYNDGTVPAWCITRAHYDVSSAPWRTRRITEWKKPWGKLYLAEASYIHSQMAEFYPYDFGGRLRMRHLRQCNVLFLDGHVVSYRAPPLPGVTNQTGSQSASRWLDTTTEPPDGL